jgi:hypothetical protein
VSAVSEHRWYGGADSHDDDDGRRWPVWASILFIVFCSLVLWSLIGAGIWWLIDPA